MSKSTDKDFLESMNTVELEKLIGKNHDLSGHNDLNKTLHDGGRRKILEILYTSLSIRTYFHRISKPTVAEMQLIIKKIIKNTIKKLWKSLISGTKKKSMILKFLENLSRIAKETERLKGLLGIHNVRELLVVLATLLVIAKTMGLLPLNRRKAFSYMVYNTI